MSTLERKRIDVPRLRRSKIIRPRGVLVWVPQKLREWTRDKRLLVLGVRETSRVSVGGLTAWVSDGRDRMGGGCYRAKPLGINGSNR